MRVIEVIPFRSFREKIDIVKIYESKGKLEIHSSYIYIERIEKGA